MNLSIKELRLLVAVSDLDESGTEPPYTESQISEYCWRAGYGVPSYYDMRSLILRGYLKGVRGEKGRLQIYPVSSFPLA